MIQSGTTSKALYPRSGLLIQGLGGGGKMVSVSL